MSNRDINQFKNMNSFLDLMDQHAEKKTGREERQDEEQELIKSGQAVLYKDTGQIKIVIPKTEEAAKFYGRGTRWCTAGDKDNAFDLYNKDGPLYNIIFRGSGVKWQFHFETVQFMDEQDEDLDPDLVKPISGLFPEDKWIVAVRNDWRAIQYVENPSEAILMAAAANLAFYEPDPEEYMIKFMENPSEALQIATVSIDRYAIADIENPSEAVQLAAVENEGLAIQGIKNPSEAVQLAAVKSNPVAIRYIDYPSEAVQLTAVSENWRVISLIENPSEAMQLAAVKTNGLAIGYIDNPTEAVQLAAVKSNPVAIRYIDNPTEAVKMAAERNR
jgi:hypothetical protein